MSKDPSSKKQPTDLADAWMILNGLPHLGPVTLQRMLEGVEGDPRRLLGPSRERKVLERIQGVGPKILETLARWPEHFDLEAEKLRMREYSAEFLHWKHPDYPRELERLYDSPVGLYALGPLRFDAPAVAIVGSRRCTLYGLRIARNLAAGLARRGFVVVSGLARGIDTAAHEGALEVGGKTVAVLGCGWDRIYPPENIDLYRAIREKGCLLSEFPRGRRADRQTFPMRNRVVSGMSVGVVVVETAEAGGSMITARFAAEQGKTVFAVPGRVDQATSAGCHALLRDGATLVRDVDDILEEVQRPGLPRFGDDDPHSGERESKMLPKDLTDSEKRILEVFQGGEILSAEEMAAAAGLSPAETGGLLVLLELKKCIRRHMDGRYESVL